MKLPAFQFYPADWRKDPGIQSLSFHDRGIWFEILCLMHESEQRGKLLLNGKPMPDDALARLLGLDKQSLTRTLTTLLEYGVASRDVNDALINRRMVRDEEQRHFNVEYGKLGGNPALTGNYNKPGFVYAVQRASDGWVKIGISENPSKRLYRLRYQFKPDNLEMLGFLHVEDMAKAEAELHARFRHLPNSGEWFGIKGGALDTLLISLKGKNKGKQTHACSASSSSSSSEDTTTTATTPRVSMGYESELSAHWAIAMYRTRFGHDPSIPGQEMIVAEVVNEIVWQRVLDIWRGNEHTARHIWNMVDRYRREVRKDAAEQSKPGAKSGKATANKEPAGWQEHYTRELNQALQFIEGDLLEAVKTVLCELPILSFDQWKQRKENLLELGLEIV